jgi:predicted aconitase
VARGNSDGIEAAFWSAICGRTPAFGLHLPENRGGTHHFKIEAKLRNFTDWDLLGKAIGRQLPANAIPVVTGDFPRPDFNQLRQFLTALAISSNAQLCHIVGLTPEAQTFEAAFKNLAPQGEIKIAASDLAAAYEVVSSPGEGPIGLVSLGCPHYDLSQVREAARLLEGRKIHPKVKLMIWAPLSVKYLAEVNGLDKIIRDAGGEIYAGSCPTTVGPCLLEPAPGLVFDSFKMCLSTKNMYTKPVYLGGMAQCLAAAEAGQWRKDLQWRAK